MQSSSLTLICRSIVFIDPTDLRLGFFLGFYLSLRKIIDFPFLFQQQHMQNSEEAKLRRQQLLQEREKTSFRRYFTSVGCAVIGGLLSVPFVRNKVMMQCRPEHLIAGREPMWTKPLSTFRHVYKNEGNTKFVRGIIPFMTYLIPVAFIRQSSTNSFSRDLDDIPSRIAQFSRGFAAASATSLFSVPLTPFTIAATKMMADTKPAKRAIYEYHGPLTALRSVYSMGGISKLFVGAVPIWLHNMVHFTGLWAFTLFFGMAFGRDMGLATTVASIMAIGLAHPLDTIRARMQFRLHTQVTDYIPEYRGMSHCAQEIWKNEGLRGFYRGGSSAMAIWSVMFLSTLYASNHSQRLRGKEAKNEAILQRRLSQNRDSTHRFKREQFVEDRFYGFDQPVKD